MCIDFVSNGANYVLIYAVASPIGDAIHNIRSGQCVKSIMVGHLKRYSDSKLFFYLSTFMWVYAVKSITSVLDVVVADLDGIVVLFRGALTGLL